MTTTLMLMSFEHLSQSTSQPALRFLIEGFQIHFNHALVLTRESKEGVTLIRVC
jgi:hypothetical protein